MGINMTIACISGLTTASKSIYDIYDTLITNIHYDNTEIIQ